MNPRDYQFNLPASGRPDENITLEENWYPGIRKYTQNATSTRIYDPYFGIRAIVIHATAGSSSSGAASVIMRFNPKPRASFHWLVPDEDEEQHGKFVWATAPETRAAWHVRNDKRHADVWGGKNKVNHYSLGIEVVNAQNKRDEFSEWQYRATANIVRYCWAKYPNLVHVVSHAKLDPQRREDPGEIFDWNHFKSLCLNKTDQAQFIGSIPDKKGEGQFCC
jgi:N-acetylmuramoyl-L-alanine amidase